MDHVIAIDIGGTKTAAAIVDRHGRLVAEEISPTPVESEAAVVGLAVEMAQRLLTDVKRRQSIGAVSVGAPGTVDADRGIVVYAPNLPLRKTPLRDRVEGELGLPVFVDNDANLAALGEAVYGAGRKSRHMVMLTLGTGIGGGIVIDKKIYRGASGTAGEIGHIFLCSDGERPRDLEAVASGTALVRAVRDAIAGGAPSSLESSVRSGELTGDRIAEAARSGDAVALRAFDEIARWLGIGLATIANIFNPEIIVIGGGMADSADLFLREAGRIMVEMAIDPNGAKAKLAVAALGNRAGLMGGATLAFGSIEHI
ncbi:MAG: ROK family protein [Candidatus Aquicultorales bacterium]